MSILDVRSLKRRRSFWIKMTGKYLERGPGKGSRLEIMFTSHWQEELHDITMQSRRKRWAWFSSNFFCGLKPRKTRNGWRFLQKLRLFPHSAFCSTGDRSHAWPCTRYTNTAAELRAKTLNLFIPTTSCCSLIHTEGNRLGYSSSSGHNSRARPKKWFLVCPVGVLSHQLK